MNIDIDPEDLRTKRKTDDRGRVNLGPEFANATVTVAVVEVHDS